MNYLGVSENVPPPEMNGEVRLEMNGDSIQRVSSPENGRTFQMASSPDEKGHTLQMTPEESGDSVQMIPESNMQVTLLVCYFGVSRFTVPLS